MNKHFHKSTLLTTFLNIIFSQKNDSIENVCMRRNYKNYIRNIKFSNLYSLKTFTSPITTK